MDLTIQYRLPILEDEHILREYVEEHYSAGERSISASMGLTSKEYSQWVAEMAQNAASPNGDWGRSSLLLCFFEGELIGLLSVRYELSRALRWKYGDIGYGVRPSRRKKGFAGEMLRHGLAICGSHGMDSVIVGCYKDNLGSVGTILKNNGKLICESDQYAKGTLSQYYQIIL